MKKVLSFVLALCLICTLLPAGILTTQVDAATYTGKFDKYSGEITEGYYLITYNNCAMKATISSKRFANGTITKGAASITDPDASIVWKVEKNGSYWTLYNESTSKYAAGNGTKNNGALIASVTDYAKWTVTGSSAYEFVNLGNANKGVNKNLRNNGTYGFACYATGTGGALTLYKLVEATEPDCDHANATKTVTKDPSCTETGTEAWECDDCGETGTNTLEKVPHSLVDDAGYPATCTEPGLEAGQVCENCDYTTQKPIPAAHNYVNGKCSECGAKEPNEFTVKFELGEDGEAAHKDTSASKTDYTETVGDYTLSLTGGDKMYLDCNDAKGNGGIKLGTSSVAGKFQFTVPDEVVKVVIYVGKYKANTTKVTVNGNTYTISGASNDGKYDAITVDTTSTKTVSLTTVSGGFRAMVNAIEFFVVKDEPAAEPVAKIGDTEYETLEEAIADAAEGDIITLLTDVEIEELNLNAVILDLNGCTLTADAVVATVKDSSNGNGLIKLAEEADAVITPAATQLILWDNTDTVLGYRVFTANFAAAGMNLNEDDTDYAKSFWSDLDFTNTNAYQLIAASDMQVGFKLDWNGTEKTFWLDAAYLQDWADEKYSNTAADLDYFFYITVTGFVALTEDGTLNVTPIVADSCDNVITANAITYEFVAG